MGASGADAPDRAGLVKICVSREDHARFCERMGLRLPRTTRLVVLVDAHPRHAWLKEAMPKRTPPVRGYFTRWVSSRSYSALTTA
jgi:hypothetical protein